MSRSRRDGRAGVAATLLAVADTPLDPDTLTARETATYRTLPGAARRRGWLTARRALRAALAAAECPTDTAAYPLPHPKVSLSHAHDVAVAAVVVGGPDVVGVGVDVEQDRVPSPRIASFFLTEPERQWLATVPDTDRPAAVLRLWTVKEALFKADPANAGTVLRDYVVRRPGAHQGWAVRTTSAASTSPDFRYLTLPLPRGFVSVAVALSASWRKRPMSSLDFDRLATHISTLVSVPVERITPDTTLAELVPDSFMFVELAVDIQEEYDVMLHQEDLKNLRTVGDLASLLASRQAGSQVG